jgi:peptidoglycan/LPS O-acetylase OafA/YrhL
MAAWSVQHRFSQLDGLRGAGAVIVAAFHFLHLLYPSLLALRTQVHAGIYDTPLAILWNGRFAVSVFFVLSGFVIAHVAERRYDSPMSNTLTRYLRLAVPVTVSVIFAWALLMLFPTATTELRGVLESPSNWLDHTYQGDIPSLWNALRHGLVGNFVWGGSSFNNVLWVMQIELIGSLGIFWLYWLTSGRARVIVLLFVAAWIIVFLRPAYLAFVVGALLFEAHHRGILYRWGASFGPIALVLGILLGAPGSGFAERVGLPELPGKLTLGEAHGLIPVLAAGLIVYAVLVLPALSRFFSTTILRFLGRVSFALYLVHVPLLYTVVAYAYVHSGWPMSYIVAMYALLTLGLAYLLTVAIDEPVQRGLSLLRPNLRWLEWTRLATRAC